MGKSDFESAAGIPKETVTLLISARATRFRERVFVVYLIPLAVILGLSYAALRPT